MVWDLGCFPRPGQPSPPRPGQTLPGQATASTGTTHAQHSGDHDQSLTSLPNLKSVSNYSVTPPPEQQRPRGSPSVPPSPCSWGPHCSWLSQWPGRSLAVLGQQLKQELASLASLVSASMPGASGLPRPSC